MRRTVGVTFSAELFSSKTFTPQRWGCNVTGCGGTHARDGVAWALAGVSVNPCWRAISATSCGFVRNCSLMICLASRCCSASRSSRRRRSITSGFAANRSIRKHNDSQARNCLTLDARSKAENQAEASPAGPPKARTRRTITFSTDVRRCCADAILAQAL